MPKVTVQEVRDGLSKFLPLAAVVAGMTPTPVDDKVVQILQAILAKPDPQIQAIIDLL